MQLKVGLELLGNIVNNGLVYLTEKQRAELKEKHGDILEELTRAANKVFPEYTDIDLFQAEEKYKNFLIAYNGMSSLAAAARSRSGE